MPLTTAQKLAWNLATTLMTAVVLFRTPHGYGVMPEAEFDGDTAATIHLDDPYEQ